MVRGPRLEAQQAKSSAIRKQRMFLSYINKKTQTSLYISLLFLYSGDLGMKPKKSFDLTTPHSISKGYKAFFSKDRLVSPIFEYPGQF
jgi:hypothetical protein